MTTNSSGIKSGNTVVSQTTSAVLSNNPNSTDWTVNTPTWTLKNGYLDGSGTSAQINSNAVFSSNRTVEVDFRTVTVGSVPYYTAQIAPEYADFYHKVIFTVQQGFTIDMTVFFGAVKHDYASNSTLNPTRWYHSKVVFSGNGVTAYINGTRYFDFTDPLVGQIGGSISLASWGSSESQFNNLTVTAVVLPDEHPIADFYYLPDPGRAVQSVQFNGYPSSDPDGYVTSYSWNFGDGTTGTGQSPTHTYNGPANYTATLTVTDTSGQTATKSDIVTVFPAPITGTSSGGGGRSPYRI